MEALFSEDYWLIWMVALALTLFLPMRRLIWVLYVRAAERKLEGEVEEAEQARLKNRAGVTAALISFAFSYFYVQTLFPGTP